MVEMTDDERDRLQAIKERYASAIAEAQRRYELKVHAIRSQYNKELALFERDCWDKGVLERALRMVQRIDLLK